MTAVQPQTTVQAAILSTEEALVTVDRAKPKIRSPKSLKLPSCPSHPNTPQMEAFVSKAMSHTADGAEGYRSILAQLRKPTSIDSLTPLLLALKSTAIPHIHASTHTGVHAQLTHMIFRLNSVRFSIEHAFLSSTMSPSPVLNSTKPLDLLDAHMYLLIALVSAVPALAKPALSNVWSMITDSYLDERNHENEKEEDENIEPRGPFLGGEIVLRLHAFLAKLLRLFPAMHGALAPLIASSAPYTPVRKLKNVRWYYEQAFFIVNNYQPLLEIPLLNLIIEKAIEMDVEIRIGDCGTVKIEREKKEKESQDEIFEMDEDPVETKEIDHVKEVDEQSEKLDCLMLLIFEHLTEKSSSSPIQLYTGLIVGFETNVLATHRSKFAQYYMFVLCTKDPFLHREFITRMLHILVDPDRSAKEKESSVCYTASFCSRASFVPPATACEAVVVMLRWAEAYLGVLRTGDLRAADARQQADLHRVFYTVCQAAFYVMCFRGRSVDESESVRQGLTARRWSNLCSHSLQPLRYCLESVRHEFLALALERRTLLLEPETLKSLLAMEAEMNRQRQRKEASVGGIPAIVSKKRKPKGGVGGLGRGSNPLQSFFPFDPYLLRDSYKYVGPHYISWDEQYGDLEDDEEDMGEHDDGDDTMEQDDEIEIDSDHHHTHGDHVDDESDADDFEEAQQAESLLSMVSESLDKPGPYEHELRRRVMKRQLELEKERDGAFDDEDTDDEQIHSGSW